MVSHSGSCVVCEEEEEEAVEEDVAIEEEAEDSESEAEDRAAGSPAIPQGIVVSFPRTAEQQ